MLEKYLLRLIIFISILCHGGYATAAEHMRSLTIYEGLAGESVYSIYRDKAGLTWIGTVNGITCYDGYSMTSYNVNGKRSKNSVNGFATTSDGTFYAAANSGLYIRDNETGLFRLLDNTITDHINAITANGETLYAGSAKGLYIRYRGNTTHIWPTSNYLSRNNSVEDIKVTADGKVWVLCSNELYLYNPKRKRLIPFGLAKQPNSPGDYRCMVIKGGKAYIGTYNSGLYCYNTQTRVLTNYIDVGCNVITCVSIDKNKLYVGTDGAGMSVITLNNNKTLERYDNSPTSRYRLLDNTVYAFLRDKNGVCFFGYFRRGLHHSYYTKHLFHCYRTKGFDSRGVNVRSFYLDGPIKVLGSRGGLYFINESLGTYKFFTPAELGGSIVTNVVKYAGYYYCCTFNGGVMRIDPKTLTTSRFGKSEILRRGSFNTLVVSPDNELWMGGTRGVFVYDSATDTERMYNDHNSQLYPASCYNLMFDTQGRCWISTAKGICLYDPIEKVIHNTGFPDRFFNKAYDTVGELGDNGKLLFSCIDGLYSTNEELTQFGQIDLTQTIGNDYISQVAYDRRHHNYWVGTERGLFRFDTEFRHVAKYAQEVGLDSREFSSGAIFIDKRNRLWTGTVDGLFYADLDEVQKYTHCNAPIILSDVKKDSKPISFRSQQSMITYKSINLTYNWGVQTLSFLPLTLNYSDPDGQCYEYKVNNGEWVILKNRERAVISGEFSIGGNTLQVRLAGQKKGTTYHVSVWPSWLWVIEVIGITIFLIIIGVSLRLRRDNIRQVKQMALVQQELEETKRKYSRVATTDDDLKRLFARLEVLMLSEKPYLNQDLKLSDVAARLDVSTVKLSQMLNVYAKTNYYDFVNRYRLDEFKMRLGDRHYANYTQLALAESCGFKRSSFFATFKKVEGVTPMEYVKKQEGDSKKNA